MPVLNPNISNGDIENITGAFELNAVVRFDQIGGGSWQRVLDFGDGPSTNNIVFTQYENTSDIMFAVYQDGVAHAVIAPDAIVEGEVATWGIGVDPDGLMWIEKDGVRLSEAQGVVPNDVPRGNELLGQSNWAEDADLDGAVLGIDVTNLGDTADGGAMNRPTPIEGAFQADIAVRIDDLARAQPLQVFHVQDASGANSVTLEQLGASGDMRLQLVQDGVSYSATASDAITEGDLAYWSSGVDPEGLMWIERDGEVLAERKRSR